MAIWSILWIFGIFYDHLVHFAFIRYIFPVLVSYTKKNLATLVCVRDFFQISLRKETENHEIGLAAKKFVAVASIFINFVNLQKFFSGKKRDKEQSVQNFDSMPCRCLCRLTDRVSQKLLFCLDLPWNQARIKIKSANQSLIDLATHNANAILQGMYVIFLKNDFFHRLGNGLDEDNTPFY
jgi:hypothetical protein